MGGGERDDVPRSRIDLPVAPERVSPVGLRAAVNIKDERVLSGRVEAVWLHNEYLYFRAVGSIDPHAFGRTQIDLGCKVRIYVRQSAWCGSIAVADFN